MTHLCYTPNTQTLTTGTVVAALTGDVTGNVSGNLTGNVTGDVTGNALIQQLHQVPPTFRLMVVPLMLTDLLCSLMRTGTSQVIKGLTLT